MTDTANITLRNFPIELRRKLRIAALEANIPLGQYIAGILERAIQVKHVSAVQHADKSDEANIALHANEEMSLETGDDTHLQRDTGVLPTTGRESMPERSATARLKRAIPGLKTASELPVLGESRSEAKRIGAQTGKKCKHGIAKGYHCWQCGGIARIESVS